MTDIHLKYARAAAEAVKWQMVAETLAKHVPPSRWEACLSDLERVSDTLQEDWGKALTNRK